MSQTKYFTFFLDSNCEKYLINILNGSVFMFCSKCGNQILENSSFCSNCVTPTEQYPASFIPKNLTRNEWVNQGGNIEAAKEIKVLKILSFITIAILCLLFSLVIVGNVIMYGKINDAFGGDIDFKVFFVNIYFAGMFFVPSVIFGILGVKKFRTGFSVAYLIFGDLSFLFSVGQLLGGGLHNLALLAVMSVPFAFIIVMQSKINKKYKVAKILF